MAAWKLPALARPVYQPPDHPCQRPGCSRSWTECGFPDDIWFCTPCVPPAMRFPWEAGYVAADEAVATAPIASAAAQATFDLLPGFAPA